MGVIRGAKQAHRRLLRTSFRVVQKAELCVKLCPHLCTQLFEASTPRPRQPHVPITCHCSASKTLEGGPQPSHRQHAPLRGSPNMSWGSYTIFLSAARIFFTMPGARSEHQQTTQPLPLPYCGARNTPVPCPAVAG